MKVLVACEESQVVCCAFRNKGHNAFSCDITDCSGGHPEWHIKCNVLDILYDNWDMIIAFPPCTYMSNVGACRMFKNGCISIDRYNKAMDAKEFFMKFYLHPCAKVAIENPTPMKIIGLPKYNQVIEPYDFGHPYSKRTCLWLKGLPPLLPTSKFYINDHYSWVLSTRNPQIRSKTFYGVAHAMAAQWG